MSLETATYTSDLVSTNPTSSDAKSQGDDHIRLLKATIKATFPNVTGAMTATHTQLNTITAKADLASPAFTGVPTAPTAAISTNDTQIATTAFVQAATFIAATPPDPTTTLTDAATVNWNINNGTVATLTLGGNRTMAAPTNLSVRTFILKVIQDGTGSRTITWNSVFKWASGVAPVLSTAAGATDIISFFCDGTNLYGSYIRGAA
jgi:hypothetical protein